MFEPPYDVLRNTKTLEAWRAYNRKANAPLFFSMFPAITIGASTPAMIALLRHSHTWLPFAIILACEALFIVWLVIDAFRVRAYKRAHPFIPPPVTTWTERNG